jgi:glycosyltransferase involved in cell wall biosynthesis
MNRIKLCNVVNGLSVGGVTKVLFDTILKLDADKYEISVISLSSNTEVLSQIQLPDHIKLILCNYEFDKDYSLKRYLLTCLIPYFTKKKATNFLKQVVEIDPDILHFHTLPRELMLGVIAKKKLKNSHLIFTDHTLRISQIQYSDIKSRLLALAYRNLYRKYNIISVSKSVRKSQEDLNWLNPKLINRLIENRIDIYNLSEIELEKKDSVNVVYVSRLSPKKGHIDLLKVWKKLNYKNHKLTLVGGGALEIQLKDYIQNHLIGMQVSLTGTIDNVTEYLMNSDIAVFPSEKEGLPIALLEKMAIGLPVIVKNIPELTDFISDSYNGYTYDSLKEFAYKLDLLISDLELRKKMGKNAHESIIKRMGKEEYSESVNEFYKNVLNQ